MANDFSYDVFLSHSTKDKPVVRAIAKRLRADGLRVWLDDWEIRPGDSITAKIEEGLEHSRVLVLCMSAKAFGSDWAQLESGTFRFRDPLNKERRFIPLRLDEAPIKGSLAQFLHINWHPQDNEEQAYAKLFEACRPPARPPTAKVLATRERFAEKAIKLNYSYPINAYAFSLGDKHILSGNNDRTVRLWDMEVGSCLRVLKGHAGAVNCVAWSADGRYALSGSTDRTLQLWDVEIGKCLRVNMGHTGSVRCVALSVDGLLAISGSNDRTLRLWDMKKGRCLRVLEGHTGSVNCVAWSADGRHALSGSNDRTLQLWDVKTGRCLSLFLGHTGSVRCVALSDDGLLAISGSADRTLHCGM